jgi:hypothetical protein
VSRVCPALGLTLVVALAPATGCLFAPDVASHGYTDCTSDDDCAAGRSCALGLCAPPPWNDPAFAARRLLVVDNTDTEQAILSGAAVPVRIGAAGLLQSADLGVDGRFTFYDRAAASWTEVPVFRDIYDDQLIVWVPVQEEVPPGASAQLAWLENATDDLLPTVLEEPERVFSVFEDFPFATLDADTWSVYGAGEPTVQNGIVNIADNQKIAHGTGLAPPFSVVARGRINGNTCDQVFVGVVSDDGAGFEPPSAGFFVQQNLATILEVGPAPQSVPQQPPDLEGITLDTAEHRFRIDVGPRTVRFWLDDEPLGSPELVPPFAGETLYFMVDVDGACSFDLTRLMVSPLPFATPEVRAEGAVAYEILE